MVEPTGAETCGAGPEVEREVVVDMIKRALPLLVPLVGLAWLISGPKMAASVGLAVALVLVNFLLAAAMLSWGARTSSAALMGAALGGFLLRMVLLLGALLLLRHRSWVSITPLALTLLVSHVALLVWELRRVSASLAYPGLKPVASKSAVDRSALNPRGA
ncbi:MAG: hypothetical protein ACRDRT_16890 [Pseudonocardiaceae bacterium]